MNCFLFLNLVHLNIDLSIYNPFIKNKVVNRFSALQCKICPHVPTNSSFLSFLLLSGFNITNDLPLENVKKPEDHSGSELINTLTQKILALSSAESLDQCFISQRLKKTSYINVTTPATTRS